MKLSPDGFSPDKEKKKIRKDSLGKMEYEISNPQNYKKKDFAGNPHLFKFEPTINYSYFPNIGNNLDQSNDIIEKGINNLLNNDPNDCLGGLIELSDSLSIASDSISSNYNVEKLIKELVKLFDKTCVHEILSKLFFLQFFLLEIFSLLFYWKYFFTKNLYNNLIKNIIIIILK